MMQGSLTEQTTNLLGTSLPSASAEDFSWMAQALNLARRGLYSTQPNPRVGCIIVVNSQVVGEGWHQKIGHAHAEVTALKQAGHGARHATLYVTLEPCTHHGRTPPCVDAIIKAGVSRVVIAMSDPNPLVNQRGIVALKQAGIRVSTGVCQVQAEQLNRGFVSRMERKRPWVTLKIGASLDGKTALINGASQWITAVPARHNSHQLRASSCAIMTGIGTILRDDPSMTARIENVERQPLRVILDSNLSTPPTAKFLRQPGKSLIITSGQNKDHEFEALMNHSIDVITISQKDNRIDLDAVLLELNNREINNLLLEAGARLSGAMLKQGLVDELVLYIAPDLLGSSSLGMFEIPGISALSDRLEFEFDDIRRVGRDLRLTLSCHRKYNG